VKVLPDVLIVDDNTINRRLAAYLLTKAGLKVFEASSGKDVFEFLAKHVPDVILLDIQLPEMDGVDILKRIRASEIAKKVIVVAVTAYTMRGDKEKFESAGFDGYLPKPIDAKTFANQVLEIYSNASRMGTIQRENMFKLYGKSE
jgi:CheY-like chemotaxis protein